MRDERRGGVARDAVRSVPRAHRRYWYPLAAAAVVVLALAAVLGEFRDGEAAAQGQGTRLLTGSEVATALRAAGLTVNALRAEPLQSSPSGPPATESEALRFTIPGVEGGGRILIFANDDGLQKKAAWFRRSGAAVIVFRNVILWLDPELEASLAARYRQALQEVR